MNDRSFFHVKATPPECIMGGNFQRQAPPSSPCYIHCTSDSEPPPLLHSLYEALKESGHTHQSISQLFPIMHLVVWYIYVWFFLVFLNCLEFRCFGRKKSACYTFLLRYLSKCCNFVNCTYQFVDYLGASAQFRWRAIIKIFVCHSPFVFEHFLRLANTLILL